MVPKLQETILKGTRRHGLLEHCFVINVTISPLQPRMTGINTLLKNQSAPKPANTFKCTLCYQEFPGFHALRQDKNTEQGFPVQTTMVFPDDIVIEVDDTNLIKELCSCQLFSVDSEFERARHKVFNHAVENLNQSFLKNLRFAAKVHLNLGSL